MPIKGAILFVLLIGSIPACFFRPFYGALVWTIIAFANPQSALFYWTAANTFPWAVAVAVPTLLGFALSSPKLSNLVSKHVFFLILLWGWFTLTTLISTHDPVFAHHSADTWYRWGFISKVLLMAFVTTALLDSLERLRIFALVIAGCFGYFVLKSFPFLIMTGGAFRLYGPEYSMIADNNDFGLALNMTIPLFFFLAQTETNRWIRYLAGLLFVLCIPAIFFTYSRGALVGLIAVLFGMLLLSKKRLVLIPVIAFAIGVALLFAPAAWKHRMDPTRSDAIDGSAHARLDAWSFAWSLFKDNPVVGGGFDTFTPELFKMYSPNASDPHGPHSVYFQILAEHGCVGFALYMLVVGCCFGSTFRLVRVAKFYGDDFVRSYANMFRFCLVGFLVSGLFLGRAYFDYYFTIVACLAALEKLAFERWALLESEENEEFQLSLPIGISLPQQSEEAL